MYFKQIIGLYISFSLLMLRVRLYIHFYYINRNSNGKKNFKPRVLILCELIIF